MNKRNVLMLFAVLFALGQQLHAQVKVDMRVQRSLYMAYEPILITVAITNLSGHDLTLKDEDGQKWFGFQVVNDDGQDKRLVAPLDPNYHVDPLTIPSGQTVKRSLNLGALYGVQEFGLYRVKATIYDAENQKYFSSPSDQFQVAEGKLFWQQTVGVPTGMPGAGSNRTISLLTFRLPKENMLYVRVEDKEGGLVYITNQLGRLLIGYDPDIQLDKDNQLHVLQLVAAKTYVYSRIGLNGEWLGQKTYNVVNTKPVLKKASDGQVVVLGGQVDVPIAPNTPNTRNFPTVLQVSQKSKARTKSHA